MLKSWSIQNFKAIVDSGNLKLAPVTVLAGRNSSGKSSLLQSILMISQTLSSRVRDRALLPNGPIVQLGTFASILSDFSTTQNMSLAFEIDSEREDIGQNLIDLYQTAKYIVHVVFTNLNSEKEIAPLLEASQVVVESISIRFIINVDYEDQSFEETEISTTTHDGEFVVQRLSGDALKRFIKVIEQDHFLTKYPYQGKFKFLLRSPSTKDTNLLEPLLVSLSNFLPTELSTMPKENNGHSDFLPASSIGLETSNVETSSEGIARFFSTQIRYLGPLRADPSIVQQQFSHTGDLDDVGSKGEYAATVYNANRLAIIEHYNPTNRQIEQTTLQAALDIWAKYLEVADEVKTEVAGTSGITWKVALKQGQKTRTLPQVGVGVSQILPILVMGLLSPKGSLLIIEQPELHLHARVQARLGDFFVGLSKCNKQCLIETHSENLVSQLRLHIVQSDGLENSDCMIYFVDQDEQGAAMFEEVKISERGNILNWPDGFFDETMHQEDKITAASIRRRAKLAKKND